MSSNHANTHTANGRSTFATSSSDFALPFGSSRSAATTPNTNNDSSSSNAGFFQSGPSSIPISIPSSPSLSLSFNQASASYHATLLSLGSSPSKLATHGAGLGIGNLPSPSARDHSNPLASAAYNSQPQSPTLSLAGEGWPPPPFNVLPPANLSSSSSTGGVATPAALLRRGPGMNSPGFAIASPARFRRASMLGREITPFSLDQDDRSDEPGRSHNKPETQQRRRSNQDPDDGDDEMMQVEDDDAARAPSTPLMGPPMALFSTPSTPPPGGSQLSSSARPVLASSALARASASDSGQDSSSSTGGGVGASGLSRAVPRSPSTGPSMGSPLAPGNRSRSSSLLSSNVVRKSVTRRGNLLPKDRSVARVAASLQDESKPEDSEIASEAKLQKRLGGEATLPRTPRFGPSAGMSASGCAAGSSSSSSGGGGTMRMSSRSPFFGAAGGSGTAGSSGAGFSRRKYMWDDDVDDIRGVFTADGLEDESSGMSSEEEEMMYYSRNSLSDEEDEMRSRGLEASNDMQDGAEASGAAPHVGQANAGGVAGSGVGLSTSFGSATAGSGAGMGSGGGVGSLPKRKNNALWMGFRDKGNAHKWSPGGSGSVGAGSGVGASNGVFSGERAAWRRPVASSAMDLDTSPRVLGASAANARLSKRKTMGDDRYEPYKRRAVSPMNLGSSLGTTPTNPSFTAAAVAAAATQTTAGGSPLIMPISSPSGAMLYRGVHHYHAAYARYSTSPTISRPCTPVGSAAAQTSVVAAMGSFSPAAGSGPGYGSGALGLSISANNTQSLESRMQLEQQQQNEALMDEKVGLLGLS